MPVRILHQSGKGRRPGFCPTLVDENGVMLTGTNVELPAGGHTSFMLSGQIPAAANNRGWLQFIAPASIPITGLGLRANPAGGFASVPKL
jgi:hypothetical protein